MSYFGQLSFSVGLLASVPSVSVPMILFYSFVLPSAAESIGVVIPAPVDSSECHGTKQTAIKSPVFMVVGSDGVRSPGSRTAPAVRGVARPTRNWRLSFVADPVLVPVTRLDLARAHRVCVTRGIIALSLIVLIPRVPGAILVLGASGGVTDRLPLRLSLSKGVVVRFPSSDPERVRDPLKSTHGLLNSILVGLIALPTT